MRRLGLALALLLAAACDAGGGVAPTAPGTPTVLPSAAGTLRVAVDEPEDLLPQRADTQAEQWVADALFDGLTRWGRHQRPEPAAAAEWVTPDGGRTWVFSLRARGRWHDGTDVTAGDVVRGWTVLVREGPMSHLLYDVEGYDALRAGESGRLRGLRVLDPLRLEVRLRTPDADFPAVVGHPALAPLPERWAEPGFAEHPVGNGPFAAAEARVAGRFVRARRFDGWLNGPRPRLDEVVFQTMTPSAAYVAFQQGRVHVAPIPPGALRDALTELPGAVRRGETADVYLLGLDVTRPPFDRLEVRRALSLAVDRPGLAGSVLEGNAAATGRLVPRDFPEWAAEACATCERDVTAAEQAFAAAGVTSLTLAFNEGAGHAEVGRALRADLAEAGVALELSPMPAGEYFRALRGGALRLYRFGWRPDVPVAEAILRPLLHSASVPADPDEVDAVHHNHGRYRRPDVDELLDAARATMQPEVRAARYRMAERLAIEGDQALVPLFWYRHRVAVAPEVLGLVLGPLSSPDWALVRLS